MRSTQLNLSNYKTDKIEAGYLKKYDQVFSELWSEKIRLLELGIRDGGSLMLWKDYFPSGEIAGIDISLPPDFKPAGNIRIFEGSQVDEKFLDRVALDVAPDGFDIIIDDASHIGEMTEKAFWYLFDNHLKNGGIYVIEDWGTGYWSDWPDGKSYKKQRSYMSLLRLKLISRINALRHLPYKRPIYSHSYGMVGFIKTLIDEQGASDLTRGNMKAKPERSSKFERIVVYPHLVFIFKNRTLNNFTCP